VNDPEAAVARICCPSWPSLLCEVVLLLPLYALCVAWRWLKETKP
jgi:hypothetical protein